MGVLDIRELAGVIAHELGHFNQGAGMRLSYLVRTINAWFFRIVYERDAWDEGLVRHSQESDIRSRLIFYLARFCVWMSRRVLWCFFMVGHLVSCFLLRQMERDADLYEIRLGGSDAFENSMVHLGRMSVASSLAQSVWLEALRGGRVASNLPFLFESAGRTMPVQVRRDLQKEMLGSKTGLLDSHPSDGERIARARKEKSPGIVALHGPARHLLRDFDVLCRKATLTLYRDGMGFEVPEKDLVPLTVQPDAWTAPASVYGSRR